MNINRNIFREYDIRGIYGKELTDELSYHLGKAFGTVLAEKFIKTVIVGGDNRESTPSIIDNITKGIIETGVNVVNTGVSLTPELAFFTCTQGFDSAISITASHNPKEFNGIKFYLKNAVPYFGSNLSKLADRIEKEDYLSGNGKRVSVDYGDQYIAEFFDIFKYRKSYKIVVSGRTGPAGRFLREIFNNFGFEVIELDCEPDSFFPKGTPNPEDPSYMREVADTVLKNGADLGIALDTDGDRLGVCDEKGVFYETDKIFMLLASEFLKENKGAKIVYDVKCSEGLKSVIEKAGGVPKMVRTGRTVFSQELHDGAVLGAEYAGHIYYGKEFYGIDDAIFTACKVVEALDNTSKKLSELFEIFPKTYHTGELKIKCPDESKFEVIEKIKHEFMNDKVFKEHIVIDGVRAYLNPDSWVLVRVSNTSPYLSARFESQTEEGALKLKEKLSYVVGKVGLDRKYVEDFEIHRS